MVILYIILLFLFDLLIYVHCLIYESIHRFKTFYHYYHIVILRGKTGHVLRVLNLIIYFQCTLLHNIYKLFYILSI